MLVVGYLLLDVFGPLPVSDDSSASVGGGDVHELEFESSDPYESRLSSPPCWLSANW